MFFSTNILRNLILLPLVAVFSLFFIDNEKKIKNVSIFFAFSIFFFSLFLWIFFDKSTMNFQFVYQIPFFFSCSVGIDGISLFFIILATCLIPLCLLISYESVKQNIKEFYIFFFILEFGLLVSFSVLDVLIFYIFFESVLIPMFLIIGIWGSRERKIKASYMFFLYTLAGSLFMLVAIIHIYIMMGTTDYQILYYCSFPLFLEKWYWLAFFLAFAVKVPMVPFHIWLPEAHVEAPTSGSVLLAGILLKLGSYGMLRFLIPLFPQATVFFSPLVSVICIISIIYASLTAIRQTDLKRIIAYASVAHMNFIIIGLFSLSVQGMEGSIIQMISHGFVSSGLFFIIGCLYDRYHSRNLEYYGGLAQTMPLFSIFFLIYIFANISIPGTSSFVGELLILTGVYVDNTVTACFISIGMYLSGVYSLLLYTRVCYGNLPTNYLHDYYDLTMREFFIHLILIIGIFFLGIYPQIFMSCLNETVFGLLTHIHSSLYL